LIVWYTSVRNNILLSPYQEWVGWHSLLPGHIIYKYFWLEWKCYTEKTFAHRRESLLGLCSANSCGA
jgi:hypothetical protein